MHRKHIPYGPGGREEKGKTERERESLNGWSITKMEAK